MSNEKTATEQAVGFEQQVREPAPLVVVPAGMAADINALSDFGFIMPIATPELLRQAFAQKTSLMAAILDEIDYIYIVPYEDPATKKQRQYIAARRADAEKAFAAYKTEILATPKKSGIVKLASALGIECHREQSRGLPDDPSASYAWVLYKAVHKRTGRAEEGVGWCDKTEKGGRITIHELIATADTRGYNRAVLRLAGFGTVSAEEIIGGSSYVDTAGETVVEVSAARPADARPPITDEQVLAAARTWAEAVVARAGDRADRYLPIAQQASKAFRELRARARRGDLQSAKQLGTLGLHWEGAAQDSSEYDTFQVEPSPVSPEDVQRVRAAAAAQQAQATESHGQNGGAAAAATVVPSAPAAAVPVTAAPAVAVQSPAAAMKPPPPAAQPDDCITLAQAKMLSELLLKTVGTKEDAIAWLTQNAGVTTSKNVKSGQFDSLMNQIKTLSTKES